MPIYNGIEFLDESISSIKNQIYTEWELLIGINGHSENSEVFKIANRYSSENIHVLEFPELKGKSITLNRLLVYTKFDIICLLDVDDIWLPEKLAEQVQYIDKYDVVGTHCQYFGESDCIPQLYLGDIIESNFSDINTIINSSSMINRKGRDISWDPSWDGVEDYELWIRLIRGGWTFFNIDDMLVKHRIHRDSFFNTKNSGLSESLKKLKFNI
jgi:teichuronic acid biosynthesis glycosyltransferase TuaG